MNLDIGEILDDWPYEPEKISARLIEGRDGRPRIQLRLDCGLLQMACQGRPDGARPHGCDSALAHYEELLRQQRARTGGTAGFELDSPACEELRREGALYYHRYLAEFVLEDYAAVLRDTEHNLRIMDLVSAHAETENDREASEAHRPYVIMMHTRARALEAFRENRPRAALAAVQRGIDRIRTFYEGEGRELPEDRSSEIALLQRMHDELATQTPADPASQLRDELRRAVEEERYEDAAVLRDELRDIHED